MKPNTLLQSSIIDKNHFNVLVAGRNAEHIEQMETILGNIDNLSISRNHICNGHSDPLYGLPEMPDLLVFWVGENWELELTELMLHLPSKYLSLIICADSDDPKLMRLAMKAGAVDYLRSPISRNDLVAATCSVLDDFNLTHCSKSGSILTVINAKGGSGASFIACNIADIMAESSDLDVALIGLDIQFGSHSGYLDIDTEYGLIEALDNIEDMDSAALRGYMMQHSSGIHLLDVKPGALLTAEDIDPESLSKLLNLMATNYDQVIIDLPRQIDQVSSTVIECTDKILIVVQQSIAHIHDAMRLLEILQRDLLTPKGKIAIVVNRYDKSSDLTLKSISKMLNIDSLLTIPNSFDQVSESINGGEPIYAIFRRAAVTKALIKMKDDLLGQKIAKEKAVLGKLFDRFRGI